MRSEKVATVAIRRFDGTNFHTEDDLLVVEEPLEIRLGFGEPEKRQQKSIAVTMRTPGNDLELAAGFLFGEGIVNQKSDILSIDHCRDAGQQENPQNIVRVELTPNISPDLHQLERHFYTTSSCGICGKASIEAVRATGCELLPEAVPQVDLDMLLALPEKLKLSQPAFRHTGGLHAAGFFSATGELLWLREDVGRHNALDKLIGVALFSNKLPLPEGVILVSGRGGFELIQKMVRAGGQIFAAVGAPSNLAVELARQFRLTVVGFLRENRCNIYTFESRIRYPNS